MPMEIILECIKQKETLFTMILNLTKRMEVRCRQEEVDFEDFVEQRKSYMDRIDKCDALIQKKLTELENEQERLRLTSFAQGKTEHEPASEEERILLETAIRCKKLAHNARSVDSAVTKMLTAKRNDLRNKLNELRRKELQLDNGPMFHQAQG